MLVRAPMLVQGALTSALSRPRAIRLRELGAPPVDSSPVELQATRKPGELAPGRRAPRLAVIAVLALASVALVACSPAAGGTHSGVARTSVRPRRTLAKRPAVFGVGYGIVTWTDKEGYTENFYEGTTQPGRVLQVEIFYPSLSAKPSVPVALAAPAYRFGPYPVIVFAHGFAVDPNTYRALLVSWVEAGYVVVAPFFPDTSSPAIEAQHGADTELDMFNQPADVAFVVSQVVKAEKDSPLTRVGYLAGMMNTDRLVLAGQSDGGDTVAALMYDRAYASTRALLPLRPVAVALLSGAEWTRSEDVYSAPSTPGPPVLVVQSLTDACNYPVDSSRLYNMVSAPKWFLALDNATHLGPYVGLGAAAPTVEKVTVDFFDLATGQAKTTPAMLERDGDKSGISTITSAASVPLYPTPAWEPDACAPPTGVPTD